MIEKFSIYYATYIQSMYPLIGNPLTHPETARWKGVFNLQAHKYIGAMAVIYHLIFKNLGMIHLVLYFLPVYWLMKYNMDTHDLMKGPLIFFAIVALNGFILWV